MEGQTLVAMTLVSPLVTDSDEYIQETIDMYTDERCKVTILRPNECGRRVFAMHEKYGDYSKKWLQKHPYISMVSSMHRVECHRIYRSRDSYGIRKKIVYPGMPCAKCYEFISIGTKCVLKKGGLLLKDISL